MHADRTLLLASVANLRDVGGLPTAGGRRVRTGLLYRSTALDKLEGADAVEFARLGIRTVFDFRTESERSAQPDRVLPDPAYVVVDVLRDLSEDTPGQMMESMRDPAAARATFGEGKGVAMFVQKYAEFVSLGSARLAYRRLFGDLTDERNRPALIHCSTGKDRTGWAAASLLLLLGVSPDLVMQDFLASNEYLEPTFRSILDDFEARGGDPELLSDFLRVRPDYLEAALHEMRRSFGTIERYFAHGLQLDSETLRALREAFLDDT